MIIFDYIWHFFFHEWRILNLREIFAGRVPRRYFNDFAVFQVRDFNGSGPASVNFSSSPSAPARSAPTSFLSKNFWFPALKFLHSFSVHDAAKGSGAFQYLRSILCQLSRSWTRLFLSMCHSRFPKLDINGDLYIYYIWKVRYTRQTEGK